MEDSNSPSATRIDNDQSAFQFNATGAQNEETVESEDEEEANNMTYADVRDVVVEEFDAEMWEVTEALLSAHATLLIDSVQNCTGLIVVGDSGAGKTTAIRFIEGLDEQVYRSDEMTPASFVTHQASMSEEELQEIDLLPRIKHKTLTCRDMATWFSGEWDAIYTRMARMAHLMDGEGLTRDSGSQGQRGYEGDDYRFTVLGATTPLSPRAWEVMGHTGQRFVFHEKRSEDTDLDSVKDDIFGERPYMERVEECRATIHEFLHDLWAEHGGYKNVENIDVSDDAQDALLYLGQVVKYARAVLSDDGHGGTEVTREGMHRVVAALRDIAKGRAILDDRTTVSPEDVQVSARIALSTMPNKRRPLVRALLDPSRDPVGAVEVEDLLDVSRPTANDRMGDMVALGIGEYVDTDDGRNPMVLKRHDRFAWPDSLDFPTFGGEQDE